MKTHQTSQTGQESVNSVLAACRERSWSLYKRDGKSCSGSLTSSFQEWAWDEAEEVLRGFKTEQRNQRDVSQLLPLIEDFFISPY